MHRLALLSLVIFLSSCAASEQADYGWVAKPKRSVHRFYPRSEHTSDREYRRTYFYDRSGELDSISEVGGWFKNVYSGFHIAVLSTKGNHYSHSHNIVPWDASVAATVVKSYYKDTSDQWIINSLRVDSLTGDQLRSTMYTQYHPEISSMWRGDVYLEDGTIVGAEQSSVSDEGYQYSYEYSSGKPVRLMSTFRGRPFWRQKFDSTRRSLEARREAVPILTDTVAIYEYKYGIDASLVAMEVQTFEGQNMREYSRKESISQIRLADSVSVISRNRYGYLMKLSPATTNSVEHIKSVLSSSGPYRVSFKATLDDRYRIISVIQEDSNETRTSYFDDNAIKEVHKIWHREGRAIQRLESWEIRDHDRDRRVVKTEWWYKDSDGDEHRYIDESFEY